jgi:anti-sigma regulatory factor (Ser/Thr protein kinase)
MEAAKPAPDRWRLISRWLGISVSTMLLADDLISEAEAATSRHAEANFVRFGRDWDVDGAALPGTFFAQSRALIQDGVESAAITTEQADELGQLLDRLEQERRQADTTEWAPGQLRKASPAHPTTASAARQAVSLVAGDIPADALQTARLLTTELVTNSIRHGPPPPATIDLLVDVSRDQIRVEVSDTATGTPTRSNPRDSGGYGLQLLDRLATHWDTTRQHGGNHTWFELDLSTPGSP